MSSVLNIDLPEPIPDFVSFVRLFFLDLRQIVRTDCWDAGGLYFKLIINVFIVPILFFFGCYVVYLQQRKTAAVIIAAGGADESALATVRAKFKQNVFVGSASNSLACPVSLRQGKLNQLRWALQMLYAQSFWCIRRSHQHVSSGFD